MIIPAPTVPLVRRSITIKAPVVRLLLVTIEGNRRIQRNLDLADLVQLQAAGRPLFQGIHIDTIDDARLPSPVRSWWRA